MMKKNMVYGAIAGDIIGSRFEWNEHKSKDFDLFTYDSRFTDDSVMTIAVYKALTETLPDFDALAQNAVKSMQQFGNCYPDRDYGGSFRRWLRQEMPEPYYSWGNGAAMRVSGCGFIAKTLEQAKYLSEQVTSITHNHPQGLKGAEATAVAVFMAQSGSSKDQIRQYMHTYYELNFNLDDIRPSYGFDESCQGTVPYALQAFFESTDFEDAIRNAISIGGDSDTIGAITGGVAGAYYGVPEDIKEQVQKKLSDNLLAVVSSFENALL